MSPSLLVDLKSFLVFERIRPTMWFSVILYPSTYMANLINFHSFWLNPSTMWTEYFTLLGWIRPLYGFIILHSSWVDPSTMWTNNISSFLDESSILWSLEFASTLEFASFMAEFVHYVEFNIISSFLHESIHHVD